MKVLRSEERAREIPAEAAEQVRMHIESRLGGRVCDLRIVVREHGLVLQGRTRSQHARQLAQEAAMEIARVPIVANEIIV